MHDSRAAKASASNADLIDSSETVAPIMDRDLQSVQENAAASVAPPGNTMGSQIPNGSPAEGDSLQADRQTAEQQRPFGMTSPPSAFQGAAMNGEINLCLHRHCSAQLFSC